MHQSPRQEAKYVLRRISSEVGVIDKDEDADVAEDDMRVVAVVTTV